MIEYSYHGMSQKVKDVGNFDATRQRFADYYEELNRQPFAEEEIPCESCGKLTKGRYKNPDNPKGCCGECWSRLPVMD